MELILPRVLANGREGLKQYDPKAFVLTDGFYSGRIAIQKVEPGQRRANANNIESKPLLNSNPATDSK